MVQLSNWNKEKYTTIFKHFIMIQEKKENNHMTWWNEEITTLKRVLLVDKYYYILGNVRRVDTLSEKEIEKIYNMERSK